MGVVRLGDADPHSSVPPDAGPVASEMRTYGFGKLLPAARLIPYYNPNWHLQ